MDDYWAIPYSMGIKFSVAECKHYNGEWMLDHFWWCRGCQKPIPPKDQTYKQRTSVFYAAHWDEYRKRI